MATALAAGGSAGRGGTDVAPAAPMGARVLGEQIRLLYQPLVPLAVNVIIAAIAGAVVWPRLSSPVVVLWVTAMVVVIFGRLMLRRAFRSFVGDTPAAVGWARAYAVGAGVTGALWGAMAGAVPLLDSPLYHMLVGLTAAGMCAGAVASLAVHLPAFFAFLLPCLVPIAGVFLVAPDAPHRGLGAMVVVFGGAMALIARGSNAALAETLRLRFHNADLVRELSMTRDMAEQATRSNWETLAHLSHELRTPLNAIGGFADLMCRHMFGVLGHAKYDEYARDIRDSATHLTELVEQILLYSRGHTGALRFEDSTVDAGVEIEACLQMIRQTAHDAGVRLLLQVAPHLPPLQADPVKLRQIVLNLLSNAIKFTPVDGQVTVEAHADPDGTVVISIADTGIGMEPADLPRVVEPYVQLGSAFLGKRQSGLGLGLPIVKRLVELHGGTLKLESAPGRGTTAIVRFPAERSAPGG